MIRLMASVPPLLTAVGVEVGKNLGCPGAQGAAEPGHLGNRTGVEAVQNLDRDLAALDRYCAVDGAELLITARRRSPHCWGRQRVELEVTGGELPPVGTKWMQVA